MDTYYNPEDLAKFGTIGEKAPELAEKFFSYYNAVFEEGALEQQERNLSLHLLWHTRYSAHTVLMLIPMTV